MIKYILTLSLSLAISTSYADLQPPPTITESTTPILDTPLAFLSDNYDNWMEGLRAIEDKNIKEVTLRVSGIGGALYIESQVARKIQQMQNEGIRINMEIVGRAVSGSAYIVCFADSYKLDDNSMLYFHPGASERSVLFGIINYRYYGKGTLYDDLDMEFNYNQCIKSKILTVSDVNKLKEGYAVVFTNTNGKITKSIGKFDQINDLIDSVLSIFEIILSGFILIFLGFIVAKILRFLWRFI